MDIYITGKKSNEKNAPTLKVQLNMLPESIKFQAAASMAEYTILDRGKVSVPNGSECGTYSWSSILPGKKRIGEPWMRGTWVDPLTIQTYFSHWKENGIRLRLTITGTPINHYVYLQEYEVDYTGAYGDYSYSVTFVDARLLDVKVTKKGSKNDKNKTKGKRQTPAKNKKYKVKKGDSLWKIAVKYYKDGSKYTKIYNANKKVIEKEAKKHGKSGPNWIYPGTVLTIP